MSPARNQLAVNAATFGALAMIAHQVGIKAARDALFLSSLGIEALPAMIAASAAFSIVAVLLASRLVAVRGPAVVIPGAFLVSAVLLVGEWALWYRSPGVGAVAIYLHVAALGSFLVSGFWSTINERFDPRSGKKTIAAIGRGAAIGGVVGGLVAERVAGTSSAVVMLPVLSAMHVLCAVALYMVGRPTSKVRTRSRSSPFGSGVHNIVRAGYLRNIAALTVLVACSGTLIDYAFKSLAYERFGEGEELLRFFAVFYAAVGVATLVLQSLLSRPLLERAGLSRTVSVLPLVTALGGLAVLGLPGIVAATLARGGESSVRSSIFRSGYELLYVPISAQYKRASKAIIDVGCDRFGDVVAAAIIAIMLLAPWNAVTGILVVSIVVSAAAYTLSGHLQRFYVETLKSRLVNRAEELEAGSGGLGGTPTSVLGTLRSLNMSRVMKDRSTIVPAAGGRPRSSPEVSPPPARPGARLDPLDSGDPVRVREVLETTEVQPATAARIIDLLAWDEASEAAVAALKRSVGRISGQLADSLVNPDRDFAVRRRIPRVLSDSDSPLAVEGLMAGLNDPRFEVRYQCAGALARIRDRKGDIGVSRERLESAVLRELEIDPKRWRARRLVDSDFTIQLDESLDRKLDLSLQHIFRIFSLFLDREPVRIALRGLYTDDEQLRGTALEYLESVIPQSIRSRVWPLLEDRRPRKTEKNEREALTQLMLSRQSIDQNLAREPKVAGN
jgi:hypothetical protein